MAKQVVKGSVDFTLVEQIKSGIEVHGLAWAVRFYRKHLTSYELRFFMRAAYL